MADFLSKEDIQKAKDSGQFTDMEINQTIQQQKPALQANGFSDGEINDYYNLKPSSDEPIKNFFRNSAKELYGAGREDVPSLQDYVTSGMQKSVPGLAIRGEMPNVKLPSDSPLAQTVAETASQFAGDYPVMLAGAGIGGTGGGPVGAIMGAFGLPAGLRKVLVDSYQNGEIKDFSDFWNRTKGAAIETYKGEILGGIMHGTGKIAPALVKFPAEVAAMTATGAALEGQMPTAKDFITTAVVLGGFKGANMVTKNLTGVFADTGKRPKDVAAESIADPSIKEDILSSNIETPRSYMNLVTKPEPPEGPPPGGSAGGGDKVKSAILIGGGTADVIEPSLDKTSQELIGIEHPNPEFNTFSKTFPNTIIGTHEAAKEWVLEKGRQTENEHAVMVNGDTGEAPHITTTDNKKSVSFSSEQMKVALNADGNFNVHHNHPSNRSLSQEDLNGLVDFQGLKTVIAHGHAGDSYAASRGEALGAKTNKEAKNVLDSGYSIAEPIVRSNFQELIRQGRLTIENAQQIEADVINRSLSRAGIIKYNTTVDLSKYNPQINSLVDNIADNIYNSLQEKGFKYAKPTDSTGKSEFIQPESGMAEVFGKAEELRKDTSGQGSNKESGASDNEKINPPSEPPGGDTPEKRILDKISVGDAEKKKYTFDNFYTDFIDNLHPLNQVVKAIKEGKDIPTSEDPYKLARLTRGVNAKADHFLNYGTFDFNTYKETGRGLRQRLASIFESDGNLDGWRAYAVAKRTLELSKRKIETGINIEDAKKVVKEGKYLYDKVAQDVTDFSFQGLKYLKDSGILSEDDFKVIEAASRDYTPLHRVMDSEKAGGLGKGMQARNPVKSNKGSERVIVDPLESTIKNIYLYINLAERNEVAKKLVELAEASPKGDNYIKKAKPSMTATQATDAEMAKYLKPYEEELGIKLDPNTLTLFRANSFFPKDNQVVVYRDGKRQLYEVDPDLAKTLKALDVESANMLIKMLGAPARVLRAGVTLNPDFFAKNINRDQLTAGVFSIAGYRPFIDMFSGLGSLINKDEAFRDWMKSGGGNATFVSLDRQYLQENMQKMLTEHPVRNLITNPLQGLRIISELAENSTRVGEFKRVTKGKRDKATIQKAGFDSREVTLDFARMGAKTRAVNQIMAFWNATLQGQDRVIRSFKDRPFATTAKIAAGITLPSVMLYLSNRNDQRYKDLPNWQKDLYWIIPTKDHIYRIPKPFELGVFFGSGAERMTEYILSQDSHAFDNFLNQIGSTLAPGAVPTILAPFMETWANRSLFSNTPIIPADREDMLPQYQYQPYTSELSKKLGSMISSIPGMDEATLASPANIDTFVRDWSGGLGTLIVNLADSGLRKAGVIPNPPKPEATLADIPIIKSFVVRYPSMGTQPINDFYDYYNKNNKAIATVKKLAASGHADVAMMELQKRQNNMFQLTPVKQGMDNNIKAIRLIEENPNFTPTEKRQLIDQLYSQLNAMAKQGVTIFRQLENNK